MKVVRRILAVAAGSLVGVIAANLLISKIKDDGGRSEPRAMFRVDDDSRPLLVYAESGAFYTCDGKQVDLGEKTLTPTRSKCPA